MAERSDNAGKPEQETLRFGRKVLEVIRAKANDASAYFDGDEGEDVFRTLYLVARATAIPDRLASDDLVLDIHMDIRALYLQVFEGIWDVLREEHGRETPIWVAVDPSAEDSTLTVMCTDRSVLLLHWSEPWTFWWSTEEAMAAELGRLYQNAASRLAEEKAANNEYGTR